MSVTHEYKIISLVKSAKVGEQSDVVSTIRGQLVSSITFTHTYIDTIHLDENQEPLETPIEQEITEEKTILEINDHNVVLDISAIDPNTFVDFASLTEEVVLGWLGTNAELEENHELVLANKKDKILNPENYEVSVVSAPWLIVDDSIA